MAQADEKQFALLNDLVKFNAVEEGITTRGQVHEAIEGIGEMIEGHNAAVLMFMSDTHVLESALAQKFGPMSDEVARLNAIKEVFAGAMNALSQIYMDDLGWLQGFLQAFDE